jgi:hypothetical protein
MNKKNIIQFNNFMNQSINEILDTFKLTRPWYWNVEQILLDFFFTRTDAINMRRWT